MNSILFPGLRFFKLYHLIQTKKFIKNGINSDFFNPKTIVKDSPHKLITRTVQPA